MRKRTRLMLIAATVSVFATAAVVVVAAESGGSYNLEASTVGAGGTMGGGTYVLNGSIGQSDAGAAMSGGAYSLQGGFWAGAASEHAVYVPLVARRAH
jgi:hypothetical protein